MAGSDLRNASAATGRRFFAWWFGELSAPLGLGGGRMRAAAAQAIMLDWRGSELRLLLRKGKRENPLGALPLEAPTERQIEQARALVRRASGRAIVLRFPAGTGLRRTIPLPPGAERDLRQILSFEMERLTPWPAEAVYFSAEIVGRRGAAREITAQLAVLPSAVVEPVTARLRQWGLKPSALELAGADGDPASGTRLFGKELPLPAAGRGQGRLLAALVAALALLWLGCGGLQYWRAQRIDALEAQLAATRNHAEHAELLRVDLARLSGSDRDLVNRPAGATPLIVLLEALSALLPDESWLTELHLSHAGIELSGYAQDAAALIPLIERSPYFTDVKFRANLVRDPQLREDRFQIGAALRAEKGASP
jgi:general secretion pathway protein L